MLLFSPHRMNSKSNRGTLFSFLYFRKSGLGTKEYYCFHIGHVFLFFKHVTVHNKTKCVNQTHFSQVSDQKMENLLSVAFYSLYQTRSSQGCSTKTVFHETRRGSPVGKIPSTTSSTTLSFVISIYIFFFI